MAPFGPIEVVVFGSAGGATLDEGVLAELRRLVDAGTVRVVDAVAVQRGEDGGLAWAEVEVGSPLAGLVEHVEGLLADEDLEQLTTGVQPGAQALVLAFENTWLMPTLAALRASGGAVLAEVAVPDEVVQRIAADVPHEN